MHRRKEGVVNLGLKLVAIGFAVHPAGRAYDLISGAYGQVECGLQEDRHFANDVDPVRPLPGCSAAAHGIDLAGWSNRAVVGCAD